ncbi:hypothetical protein GCM10020331_060220 [Ectobacillus funiculus]
MEELRKEVIDLWHFLPSLSMKVGLTAEDVYNMYMKKTRRTTTVKMARAAKKGMQLKLPNLRLNKTTIS